MKKLLLALFSFAAYAADIKISQLPLNTLPSTVNTNDSFPYVNSSGLGTTERLLVSDLPSTPAFVTKFGLFTPLSTFNAFAPSQTGNAGKFLTTNGTITSWGTISGSGTVTSVALTMPSIFSVGGSPITSSGTLAVTASGTSGGIPYFSSTSALGSSSALTANAIVLGGGVGSAPGPMGSLGTTTTLLHGNASGSPTFSAVDLTADTTGLLPVASGGTGAGSFTANAPLIGAGTSAVTVGSKSGNTTVFGTTSGSLTSGDCVQFDASGNLVDAGAACGTGGGGTPGGTSGQVQYNNSGAFGGFGSWNGSTLAITGAISSTTTAAVGTNLHVFGTSILAGDLAVQGGANFSGNMGFYGTSEISQPSGNIFTALTNLGLVTSPTMALTNLPSQANNTVLGNTSGISASPTALATTGTGSVVLATSPTLVTPALGTPSAVVLTSGTGLPLTSGVTGTLPIANGGTNKTSVTTAPAASSWAGWDANSNLSAVNYLQGFSALTAPALTSLTVASNEKQYVSGTGNSTVTLPVVSTLVLGQQYSIVNISTGTVTVQSSGSNTLQVMAANTSLTATAIATTGTTAASWSWGYGNVSAGLPLTGIVPLASGGTNANLTASNGAVVYSSASALALTSPGTAGQVLTSAGATAPVFAWGALPQIFGTRASPLSIVAATGITSGSSSMSTTAPSQKIYVQGSIAGDSVAATITAGTLDGQQMCVNGRTDANTLSLTSATTNVVVAGNVTLGADDIWCASFDGTNWVETTRSIK